MSSWLANRRLQRTAIRMALVLALTAPAYARRFHFVCRDGDPACDVDRACNGVCTLRLVDYCVTPSECFQDPYSHCPRPEFCDELSVDLVKIVIPPGSRKVVRTISGSRRRGAVFKCRPASPVCPVAAPDELIRDWQVDAPMETTSTCPAGVPLAFVGRFSISGGPLPVDHSQFIMVGDNWGEFKPFEVVNGMFTAVPKGAGEYLGGAGRAALCATGQDTVITTTIDASRPEVTGRMKFHQVVTYTARFDECPPCTMTWTGTASPDN
jgi:hypothetical protein